MLIHLPGVSRYLLFIILLIFWTLVIPGAHLIIVPRNSTGSSSEKILTKIFVLVAINESFSNRTISCVYVAP